jgi:hypothetical protein
MKYNLAKRNWNGGEQCCFCHENETIKHMFSTVNTQKILWGLIFRVFNVAPPQSVRHLFGTWLHQFRRKLKRQALAGLSAFC